MPTSVSDDELRAATFLRVKQLRDLYADRIPAKALSEGITIRGERVPIWNYQKGIYKPAVLGRNGSALTIQTSADSPYADFHDPEAGQFIYKYQGRDPEHADNRALRNAMLSRNPLLYLIAVDPGFYDAVFPIYVVGDEPGLLQFVLVADQMATTAAPPLGIPEAAMVELRRAYVTRAVVQRLHQRQFRRRVLHAYREQCAICRIRHIELLDAAHILEDKHPKGEPLVSNGLGMCKIHHSAFDAHILGIDPDVRVHIREDVLKEKDGPMLLHGLQELHGARLEIPRRAELRPDREFLAERFGRFTTAA